MTPFWVAKVGLTGAMVLYAVSAYAGSAPLPSFFRAPLMLGQVMAVTGGITHLGHYAVLRRALPRPMTPC